MEEQDDRFQPYVVYWMQAACPKCGKQNWVYNSHSERAYPEVREAAACYACGHHFWLGPKRNFDNVYGHMVEVQDAFNNYVYCWKGQATPT